MSLIFSNPNRGCRKSDSPIRNCQLQSISRPLKIIPIITQQTRRCLPRSASDLQTSGGGRGGRTRLDTPSRVRFAVKQCIAKSERSAPLDREKRNGPWAEPMEIKSRLKFMACQPWYNSISYVFVQIELLDFSLSLSFYRFLSTEKRETKHNVRGLARSRRQNPR